MANLFVLSEIFTIVIGAVITHPVMDYDSLDRTNLSFKNQFLDSLSNATPSSSKIVYNPIGTEDTRIFAGIVLFEQILAEEKANLLSSSLHLEDNEEVMHSRFNDNPPTLSKCLYHINYAINAVKRRLPWALNMIDSMGKPSSGVLQSNDIYVGNFDQCVDVDTGMDFEGQYCKAQVWISKIRNATLMPPLQFSLGYCFPSSCDAEEVEMYINLYFQSNPDISAMAHQTTCQERHLPLTTKAKCIICICAIFVLLLVIGTFYDVAYKRWWHQLTSHDQERLVTNGSSSFGSDKSHSEHEPIIDPKLQKQKMYSHNVTAENGIPFIDKATDDWTFMPVFKAATGVDTFFALSGLLLTFLTLKKLSKEEVTPKFIGKFYLHRFLRLTPPYMLILMTYVPLFKYLSDGPFWPQDGIEQDECKDTWWTNLLYLNNFVKTDKTCMSWSWYLSCDMQFHLASPLIFIPLYLFEWKGLIAPFAFLLGTAICSGVISNAKDLIALDGFGYIRGRGMMPYNQDYYKYYYIKPYTRIGPFVIGMIAGFLLFKTECKARLSKVVVVLGWMAATAMALAVIYGPHDHVRYEDRQSTDVRALYNALQRITWGISVCWVVFACANGYGGFVNTLLSWKALIPLSRLTYCAYLVHPLVIKFYFYSQRKPFYINTLNMAFVFVAAVAMSYALAYIAYLVYEIPLAGLEKAVRGRGKKDSHEK